MNNDSYIAFRINQWANWRARRDDNGNGWPSKLPGYDGMPIGTGQKNFSPDVPEECMQIESCMIALRVVNKELYDVLILAYTKHMMTAEQKSIKMGYGTSRTFYNRIGTAHNLMLGFLNDLAAGIPLPKAEG
jgi:hypothetical protein